jgi:hypothetical protein
VLHIASTRSDWQAAAVQRNIARQNSKKTPPEISCTSAKIAHSRSVKATLAQLRRRTAKVVGPVSQDSEKFILTKPGQQDAEIIQVRKIDRRAACQDLMAIGPVKFLPRK